MWGFGLAKAAAATTTTTTTTTAATTERRTARTTSTKKEYSERKLIYFDELFDFLGVDIVNFFPLCGFGPSFLLLPTAKALKIGLNAPKGKFHLPTIHFHVLCHVSFREGIYSYYRNFDPTLRVGKRFTKPIGWFP